MTLAIETSCDDTSCAVLEKDNPESGTIAQLHFHKKITSNNSKFRGVHPLVSLQSHQENLANLVSEAISNLPSIQPSEPPKDGLQPNGRREGAAFLETRRLPDFISVTRGPGMRSNLFTGLDTAKGLAVAWQVYGASYPLEHNSNTLPQKPLVGVHHMQAHALTSRLVSALEIPSTSSVEPWYPFLSVLASGGHTLLIHSASVAEHHVLGTTSDIAIGECLDKVARLLLPTHLLKTTKSTMYGALLESFVFPGTPLQTCQDSLSAAAGCSARGYMEAFGHCYDWYELPANYEEALQRNVTKWGWAINQPLTKANGGTKIKNVELSFSGLLTAVERIIRYGMGPITKKLSKVERAPEDISLEERIDIARETMRAAFEHVAYRVVLAMDAVSDTSRPLPAVVMAGGVAANSFLRHM
jgi:N6-L-threonylcarbamoyladenine synthase